MSLKIRDFPPETFFEEIPSSPGAYWWCEDRDPESFVDLIYVVKDESGLRGSFTNFDDSFPVVDDGGFWSKKLVPIQ